MDCFIYGYEHNVCSLPSTEFYQFAISELNKIGDFEAYAKGFLSEAGSALNQCEIDNLAFSAKLMTFECGMRFLTDYINGDTYFKTAYPTHNLVRAKNQFALVSDMEDKMPQMEQIIKNITE